MRYPPMNRWKNITPPERKSLVSIHPVSSTLSLALCLRSSAFYGHYPLKNWEFTFTIAARTTGWDRKLCIKNNYITRNKICEQDVRFSLRQHVLIPALRFRERNASKLERWKAVSWLWAKQRHHFKYHFLYSFTKTTLSSSSYSIWGITKMRLICL